MGGWFWWLQATAVAAVFLLDNKPFPGRFPLSLPMLKPHSPSLALIMFWEPKKKNNQNYRNTEFSLKSNVI